MCFPVLHCPPTVKKGRLAQSKAMQNGMSEKNAAWLPQCLAKLRIQMSKMEPEKLSSSPGGYKHEDVHGTAPHGKKASGTKQGISLLIEENLRKFILWK